jgi:hypothetical protein
VFFSFALPAHTVAVAERERARFDNYEAQDDMFMKDYRRAARADRAVTIISKVNNRASKATKCFQLCRLQSYSSLCILP